MTEKALEVDNVSGGYGDLKVVKEISLDVYEGSANGVTGRNGVGKTTFLKLICGALPLLGGHVRLYGRIINRLPSHSLFQLGIWQVTESRLDGRSLAHLFFSIL